jgi:hypothetical protein
MTGNHPNADDLRAKVFQDREHPGNNNNDLSPMAQAECVLKYVILSAATAAFIVMLVAYMDYLVG